MMNRIFFSIVFLLFYSCNGQNEKNNVNVKNEKMKKFDIENFRKHWDKGNTTIVRQDGTTVEQYETDEGFDETVYRPAPDFLSQYNTYDKNGNQRSTIDSFSNVSVGKSYEYDKEGKVIAENDEDAKFGKIRYPYILKFLSGKNFLDLKTGKGWHLPNGNKAISVYFDESSKVWKVTVTSGKYGPGGKTGSALKLDHIFLIDGENGAVSEK
ncbi:hypothetical protein AXA65_03330 [Chryseobacterium sp. FP211-J200]|nr:hypothetical protein AXA65_03330 [Chryseobacterium sp. FP211-J200]